MAYFHHSADFDATTSIARDSDIRLGLASGSEASRMQIMGAMAYHEATMEPPIPMAGQEATFLVPDSPVIPATPYMAQRDCHDRWSYGDRRLLETARIQPRQLCIDPRCLESEPWSANMAGSNPYLTALETGVSIQIPSGVPLVHWGDNKSGSACYQDVDTTYLCGSGLVRTEPTRPKRLQPYRSRRAPEHTNLEAQHMITADAVHNQIKEEDKTPESNRTGAFHGPGGLPQAERALREWARELKGVRFCPSLRESLTAAIKVIRTFREVANDKPCLVGYGEWIKSHEPVSKKAQQERKRRDQKRELYEELSRYYPQGTREWNRPQLLSNLLRDLNGLQQPASESKPRASTSTMEISETSVIISES